MNRDRRINWLNILADHIVACKAHSRRPAPVMDLSWIVLKGCSSKAKDLGVHLCCGVSKQVNGKLEKVVS
jgi:hypothetical protein